MNPKSPVIPNHERPEVKVAEHQEEYRTLPVLYLQNNMIALSRWELTDEELEQINENKFLYLYMTTFGKPLTPILLSTELVDLPRLQQHQALMLNPLFHEIIKDFQNLIAVAIGQKRKVHLSTIDFKWEADKCEVFVHGEKEAEFNFKSFFEEMNKLHQEILDCNYIRIDE